MFRFDLRRVVGTEAVLGEHGLSYGIYWGALARNGALKGSKKSLLVQSRLLLDLFSFERDRCEVLEGAELGLLGFDT